MEIIGSLLMSSIAGISTVLGCIFLFIKVKNHDKFVVFCLSTSLVIMLYLSVFELFPEAIKYLFTRNVYITLPAIILVFLIGIVLVNIIDSNIKTEGNDLYKLGLLNMIALMLHNIPEGIATFLSSIENPELGIKLSLAILFHNIPEGMSIAIPIYYATNNRKKAVLYTFLSGISEPIGGFVSYIFLKSIISSTLISYILIFVCGIMITISINEMLPRTLEYKQNKYLYIGIITGIIISIVNHFVN